MFECEEFGCFLTPDGYMMLTERDEFIYHEMMVHVPLAVLGETVRKVLVIGGATAAACVSCADIHISSISTWSRSTSAGRGVQGIPADRGVQSDDPRVHILYQDGLKYIRRIEDEYDLIIIDSTGPLSARGEGLFTMEFYGNCYKALRAHGVLVNQHESPFYYEGDARLPARAPQHCASV